MPHFLTTFLLFSLIHVSFGTTYFAYSTEVTCRRTDPNQAWCYRMNYLEQDLLSTDDFLGSTPLTCHTKESHRSKFLGSQESDENLGEYYEPYINIYHNCNEDQTMVKLKHPLRLVDIAQHYHKEEVNIDITNRH